MKFSELAGASVVIGDGRNDGVRTEVFSLGGGRYVYELNNVECDAEKYFVREVDEGGLIELVARNDGVVIDDLDTWATEGAGIGHVEAGKVYKLLDGEWAEVTSYAGLGRSRVLIVDGHCGRFDDTESLAGRWA